MAEKWHLVDNGLDYHLVAVFGSQSTGKSTYSSLLSLPLPLPLFSGHSADALLIERDGDSFFFSFSFFFTFDLIFYFYFLFFFFIFISIFSFDPRDLILSLASAGFVLLLLSSLL